MYQSVTKCSIIISYISTSDGTFGQCFILNVSFNFPRYWTVAKIFNPNVPRSQKPVRPTEWYLVTLENATHQSWHSGPG